jgi:hypothetical protein
MAQIPKRRNHRGGRRHQKLKQRRQQAYAARLQQQSAGGGGGGSPASVPETALFERPQDVRSDARLVGQAVRQRWQTDPQLGTRILEKVSRQALGEEPAPPFTPSQLVGVTRLHIEVCRINQADEHHRDKMEHQQRALAFRQGQVNINVGCEPSSCPTKPKIMIPHNYRDPLPTTGCSNGLLIYEPEMTQQMLDCLEGGPPLTDEDLREIAAEDGTSTPPPACGCEVNNSINTDS